MTDEKEPEKKVMLRGTSWHVPGLGRAAILMRRFGKIITFAGQDSLGRRSRAEHTDSDLIAWEATGENPQGERNSLHVCEILVEALRRTGEDWSDAVIGQDEPIDCQSSNPRGEYLQIQVVRATRHRNLWRRFTTTRSTGLQSDTPAALADELKATIDSKQSMLPPTVKAGLVLALDATRVSGYALDRVADEFRRTHGLWCRGTGFKSVWIVGPFPDLVSRVDVSAYDGATAPTRTLQQIHS
jgi:hypothetical protein